MRFFSIMILLVTFCVTASADDWTVNGKTYHNVIVGNVEADRVHVTYDGGIGTINLSDLPPDIQKKLGYDPEKAASAARERAYQSQISDLQAEVARLKEELSRYKGAVADVQAPPKIGIEAFHCFLYQNVVSRRLGYNHDGGLISDGPYVGMSPSEATVYAQQKWATMSDDEKAVYEKMAEETGDPIAKADADKAAHPSYSIISGEGSSVIVPNQ